MGSGADQAERLQASAERHLANGHPGKAAEHLALALDLRPGDPLLLEGLGDALRADGQALAACKVYEQLIRLGLATAAIWCASGTCLFELGEYAQSIAMFEQGLAKAPRDAEAHHNLARALYRLGEVDQAVGHLRQADRLGAPISPWLSLATIIPGAPRSKQRDILAVREEAAARLASSEPDLDWTRPSRRENPGRVRVAYLSAYFEAANYMKPVWAVLNHHDRERFELHLLSDGDAGAGAMTGYEKDPADRIHKVRALSNAALARRIRELGIDVLVDLNSYATASRLGLFLRPAAPVVAGWFNSFATSAMPGIDYIIGDDEVVRRRDEKFFSERVVRLPLSYLTFVVGHEAPPVASRPPGLRGGGLTFGSLVAQYKITPQVIEAWSKILRGAPGSRLLLANRSLGSAENRAWLAGRFGRRGIDSDRLMLLPPAGHYEYLKYYDRIDLALDAFPYNGGTTTMEAIWQGVPVLTFDGDRWASRTSQSLLRRTHLAEFASPSKRAMIKQAIQLANDPATAAKLAGLRGGMRDELSKSSACDGPAVAREMEAIYLELLNLAQGSSR